MPGAWVIKIIEIVHFTSMNSLNGIKKAWWEDLHERNTKINDYNLARETQVDRKGGGAAHWQKWHFLVWNQWQFGNEHLQINFLPYREFLLARGIGWQQSHEIQQTNRRSCTWAGQTYCLSTGWVMALLKRTCGPWGTASDTQSMPERPMAHQTAPTGMQPLDEGRD